MVEVWERMVWQSQWERGKGWSRDQFMVVLVVRRVVGLWAGQL